MLASYQNTRQQQQNDRCTVDSMPLDASTVSQGCFVPHRTPFPLPLTPVAAVAGDERSQRDDGTRRRQSPGDVCVIFEAMRRLSPPESVFDGIMDDRSRYDIKVMWSLMHAVVAITCPISRAIMMTRGGTAPLARTARVFSVFVERGFSGSAAERGSFEAFFSTTPFWDFFIEVAHSLRSFSCGVGLFAWADRWRWNDERFSPTRSQCRMLESSRVKELAFWGIMHGTSYDGMDPSPSASSLPRYDHGVSASVRWWEEHVVQACPNRGG
jgi:hypothetical protein